MSASADRVLGIAMVLLAAIYLVATSRMPPVTLGDPLGPAVFPYVVGSLMALTGAVLAVAPARQMPAGTEEATSMPSGREIAGVVGILCWTAVYYLVFDQVGYVPATLVYLFGLLSFMNRGQARTNAIVTVAYVIGSYWLFGALGVTLPAFG